MIEEPEQNHSANYKARIAIFTDSFLPQINGVVAAVLNLAKSLADNNYFVLIVAPSDKNMVFSYPHVKVKQIPGLSASFYEGFKFTKTVSLSTLRLMKDENIDLIHFHTPITVSYLGIKLAKKLKIPLVGTFHTFFADPAYLQHWFVGTGEASQKVTWTFSNLFYNSADLVSVPSPTTERELLSNGCTTEVCCISNGIDPSIFDNSRSSEIIKKYGLTKKVVLFTGRHSQEKNLIILLQSFIHAARQDKELSFLLVGDGPLLASSQEYVISEGMADRIIFAGAIPHDELLKSGIFGATHAFVTASLTENQPMSILEAQCNGLVCIGPNFRGIPGLIEHNVNGLLVKANSITELSEAILDVFSDEARYNALKEGTLREIKQHYLSNVVQEWMDAYGRLIEHSRAGSIMQRKGFNFWIHVVPLFISIFCTLLGEKVLRLWHKMGARP